MPPYPQTGYRNGRGRAQSAGLSKAAGAPDGPSPLQRFPRHTWDRNREALFPDDYYFGDPELGQAEGAVLDPHVGEVFTPDDLDAREWFRSQEIAHDPEISFLAPGGFPVEAAPAAAAGAPLWPLALGFGIAGVLGGLWATSEVREWKRGHYKKQAVPRGYPAYDPLRSFNQNVDTSAYYDRSYFGDGSVWHQPGEAVAPPGWARPGYIYCGCGATGTGAYRFGDMSFGSATDGPDGDPFIHCTGPSAACGGLYVSTFLASPTSIAEPFGPLEYINVYRTHPVFAVRRTLVGSYYKIGVGTAIGAWAAGTPGEFLQPLVLTGPGLSGSLGFGTALGGVVGDHVRVASMQPSGEDYRGHGRSIDLNAPVVLIAMTDYPIVRIVPQVIGEDGVVSPPAPSPSPTPSPVPPTGGGGYVPNPQYSPDDHKVHIGNVAKGYWVAVNALTEWNDALAAIWRSLPKSMRSKPKRRGAPVTPKQMLLDLRAHWQEIDAAQAVEEFVNNQIEDLAYALPGKANKFAAKRRWKAGVRSGVLAEPFVAVAGNQPVVQTGRVPRLPVPQFHVVQHGRKRDGKWITVTFGE